MFTSAALNDSSSDCQESPYAENDNVRVARKAEPPPRNLAVVDAVPHRVEITPAKSVKRQALTWTGMAAEFVESTSRTKAEYRFRAPVHLLVVYEQAARLGGETFVEGLPQSSLRDFTRKLTFVPAGREYHELHEPRTLTRLMFFYFDPDKFPLASESGIAGAALAPRLFFEDATLWDTALKLKRLPEKPSAEDRLYCEAVGAVLVLELMRLNRRGPGAEAPVRGGLAGWQQRLVTAYIEDHFAEQIPLATLAGLARLSPFHFCRAFKQSFGVPPHRYHTSRRIERAKAMLAKPEFSVTDIGLTVGFSETSSFTAAFRRATGITPTGYHRSLG